MSPPEWRECRSSTSDAKYLLRHDGAFAIGQDGSGNFVIRKRIAGDWFDIDQRFADAESAKRYLRPPIDAFDVVSGPNLCRAPLRAGDRLVIAKAGKIRPAADNKVRVFAGSRHIEDAPDGRFILIEFRGREGWVEIARFDRFRDAEEARRQLP